MDICPSKFIQTLLIFPYNNKLINYTFILITKASPSFRTPTSSLSYPEKPKIKDISFKSAMQRKEDQFQVEQPAVETSAAESNALRKKHLMIHAKIAATGGAPVQK